MEKKITHPVVDTVHQGVQEIKDVLEKQRYSSEKEPAIAALLD
ncbi:hypothetical protein [Niallia sp. Man26]|nr:hypothetical protein [Niallia sp. Man26]